MNEFKNLLYKTILLVRDGANTVDKLVEHLRSEESAAFEEDPVTARHTVLCGLHGACAGAFVLETETMGVKFYAINPAASKAISNIESQLILQQLAEQVAERFSREPESDEVRPRGVTAH